MRGFMVLCLAAVAVAAPQGYNYNQQSSVSGPSGPAFGGNFPGFGSSVSTSTSNLNIPAAGQYGSAVTTAQQPQFQHGGLHTQVQSQSGYNHQHQPEPVKETIISKRFFIHSAPEEREDEYQEKTITVGTPKKNYNVVFIKAPAKSNKKAAIKITPAVNEDKTVIYVLSKKTDASDIEAEVQEVATSTTKPEVFFIKYKTNEEAAHAQEQIQAQYDSLGGSTQVSDEGIAPVSSVIGALGEAMTQLEQAGVIGHGASAVVSSGGSAIGSVGQTNSNNGYLPPNFVYRN